MNAIGNNSILTLSRLWKGVMGVLGIVLLASCSETASVPEGDQLYNGIRLAARFRVFQADGLQWAVAQRVDAAAGHDLDRHASRMNVSAGRATMPRDIIVLDALINDIPLV